jgi:hypothetical protein
LAIGSALHVIQDSYSTSHINRNGNGEITEFYKYTKDQIVPGEYKLHCAHDQYSHNNEKQINLAIKMSSEFLSLFVENNCDSSDDQSKNTCKAIIKTWLEKKVFNLAEKT